MIGNLSDPTQLSKECRKAADGIDHLDAKLAEMRLSLRFVTQSHAVNNIACRSKTKPKGGEADILCSIIVLEEFSQVGVQCVF